MVKRFSVLDSFRGLLAFMVAIYHYKSSGPIGKLPLFINSDYFVDFFFVLSGFIIYHNYSDLKAGHPQLKFLANRLYRLYPLHFFTLLFFLFLEILKFSLYEYGLFKSQVFDKNNIYSFFVNIFFLQSFGLTSISWNYPSWSISAEMFTYIFFCLVVVYIKDLKFRNRVVSFISISLFSLLLIFLINGNLDVKMTSDFSMMRCMYSFFIGCITYEIYRKINFLKFDNVRFLASFTEGLVLIFCISSICYLNKEKSYLLALVFSLTILIFSFERGTISQWFNNKFLIRVGELSFSIYMTHAATAIFFEIVLSSLHIESPLILTIGVLLYLSTIFFVSQLTHRYVEVKFRKRLQKNTFFSYREALLDR